MNVALTASVSLALLVYRTSPWPQIYSKSVNKHAGLAASVGLAETVYGVSANVILDSACRAITSWDIVTSCIKSCVFGTIIAVVRGFAKLARCIPSQLLPGCTYPVS